MTTRESDELPARAWWPLVAVIDTCVFGHSRWMTPIIDAAHNGYALPVWSPLIISEVNRLLTWRVMRQRGGLFTPAAWNELAVRAKAWFKIMTQVFRVVDDHPPLEQAWTDLSSDAWDIPIWSAAVRAGAHFVVTENLKDGPPENADGLRVFQDVCYIEPETFHRVLDVWATYRETGVWPTYRDLAEDESSGEEQRPAGSGVVPPAMVELLRRALPRSTTLGA